MLSLASAGETHSHSTNSSQVEHHRCNTCPATKLLYYMRHCFSYCWEVVDSMNVSHLTQM
ncbi:hypothetical protein E2C01_083536 [Portunus trituberculatus]|uniref:Uncharacterized protein n=1 Tax=Portunus trituberculatus TaxID=210409 RepID=A0A5B7IVG4_PORTR|nr:hypothetical protein [Portunus trituberculatus]